MPEGNLSATVIAKVLDWPFLFFVLISVGFLKFRSELAAWLRRITEIELGNGKLHFKIGKDEVPLDKLDSTITARWRELQEEIDDLRGKANASSTPIEPKKIVGEQGIPPGLEAVLVERVYAMLKSNLWLGRYVQTLAESASVSEETMLEFCRSKSDIGLFKDGPRWVAALSDRLKPKT